MNILITAIEHRLRIAGSRTSPLPKSCRLGAVTFIQRFGKALNPHFHFHSCVIDGLFDREGAYYPINNLSPEDIHATQEHIRKRVLRLFRTKGLLDSDAAKSQAIRQNLKQTLPPKDFRHYLLPLINSQPISMGITDGANL